MSLPITFVAGPPATAWTSLNDFDGSGNAIYTGVALSSQPRPATLTITSVTTTSPAAFTSTSHGLTSASRITITGATGDWAAMNGNQIVTVTGANSFTIPVDSSAYTGSFNGTVTTYAPLTTLPVWSIQQAVFNGSSQNTANLWCQGDPSPVYAWASRTTYFYQ